MKKLLVIGKGQYSYIVTEIALDIGYKDIIYVDDIPSNDVICSFSELINSLDKYKATDLDVVISIGNNYKRFEVLKLVEEHSMNIVSIISSKSYVSSSSVIDKGCIIEAGAVINSNSYVKACSIVSANAVINHNCIIGECIHIDCNATVAANQIVPSKIKVQSNKVFINSSSRRTIGNDYKFEDGV